VKDYKELFGVAIIGAGPAGIASAVEANYLGIKDVVIFEKSESHSSTIRFYYKDNKRVDKNWKGARVELDGNVYFEDGTKESTIEYFNELIESHKIEARFNTGIDFVKQEKDGFSIVTERGDIYHAKSVIVAIGVMGKPNKPSYPIPKSLEKKVNYNVNSCGSGENIVVVGGGDSAVEYACALSSDNFVTLSYRQKEFKRVNDINLANLKRLVDEGRLTTKLGVDIDCLEEREGKIVIKFFNGDVLESDRMVLAIGGASPVDFLKKCDIKVDSEGTPVCDENLESSVRGLFIAGDIIAKSGGSIVVGLNHAFKIINVIKNRLL